VRRDHRPYGLKKALLRFERLYARHFLVPQFDFIGKGYFIVRPWHVKVFGPAITVGDYVNILAASDYKVRISVWSTGPGKGGIRIGDFCLISPAVRISSIDHIRIGNNCMIANGVYITDSDWHGIYNRIEAGRSAPIAIGDNVWIGDGAVVCKGVAIGENSIVGAGSVVVGPIPANCIAAGNPARVVRSLDPAEAFVTRETWFRNPETLYRDMDRFDRKLLKNNSWTDFLRAILFPTRTD
jgi:acetyltransferase-like isoleucine patch superfamily enzyme